jgi:hypothetical protein
MASSACTSSTTCSEIMRLPSSRAARYLSGHGAACALLGLVGIDQAGASEEAHYVSLCTQQLQSKSVVVGMPGWREQMQACMESRKQADVPPRFAKRDEMTPLGPGPVGSYMSAVLNGDFALVRRMDRYVLRASPAYVLLWQQAFPSYLGNYPVLYGSCLPADAPTVVAGRVYDEVSKDRFGNETRKRVDTRRNVPVKPALLPIAQSAGVEAFTEADETMLSMGAKLPFLGELGKATSIGPFAIGDFERFTKQLMRSRRCDDPVILKLEQQMLLYFQMVAVDKLSDEEIARQSGRGSAAQSPGSR